MNGKPWSEREIARLRHLYPDTVTGKIARCLKRSVESVYGMANILGLHKSQKYFASDASGHFKKLSTAGIPFRFKKGHVTWNNGMKGLYTGGEAGWFKKGNVSKRWDPEIYAVGALRFNPDGYVDMKIKEGSRSWRALHVVLWEDVHGPVPPGHCLRFKDGDHLNIDVGNLELISRAENLRRNTIHRLPPMLKSTINLLGQLKRKIHEKQDRRSA